MASEILNGKVALVTGSSSGMGRATALLLAKQGVKVVCCDLRPEANPAGFEPDLKSTTVELVEKLGSQAFFAKVDISNRAEVEAAFAETILRYHRLDIVVSCAGLWVPLKPFNEEDDGIWERMCAVNTQGTARVNRLAVQQFLKQDVDEQWGSRGRIVNISSGAAAFVCPGEVAYAATKASINHLTRCAAIDHAVDQININCVAPGVVATAMARPNFDDPALLKLISKSTPWPRLGTSDDIANAVLFLLSPQSTWITGHVLPVDGGATLGISPN